MVRHSTSGPTRLHDIRVRLRIQDLALAAATCAALREATLWFETVDAADGLDETDSGADDGTCDALIIDDGPTVTPRHADLPPAGVALIVVLAEGTLDPEAAMVRWIRAGAQAVVPARTVASCLGRDVLQAVLRARLRSQLLVACNEADRLALRDPLTGLLNRRGLERGLHSEAVCTVMLADIDAFKGVNDTYGHHIGDDVLRRVGATLLASCRANDLVSRVGGDEFLVVLDTDDADVAAAIAERMRSQVAELAVPTQMGTLRTSISIGVAQVRVRQLDVSCLLERCRASLRQSKQGGRNRVTMTIDA